MMASFSGVRTKLTTDAQLQIFRYPMTSKLFLS